MRSLTALTDEERRLAEKYHYLVGQFLDINRLDSEEYYDVAVFGLLRAVQAISQGRLQEGVGIGRLIHLNMKWEVIENYQYNKRQKRSGWKIAHMEDEICSCDSCVLLRGEMIADHRQNTSLHVERRELMEQALASATPNQRAVMNLKILGLTAKEIAERLKLPKTTVNSRIYKFQRKARELLKEEPPVCAGNTASGKEKITTPLL